MSFRSFFRNLVLPLALAASVSAAWADAARDGAQTALDRYFKALATADYALLKKSTTAGYLNTQDPEPVFRDKMRELAEESAFSSVEVLKVESEKGALRVQALVKSKRKPDGTERTDRQWYRLVHVGGRYRVDRILHRE